MLKPFINYSDKFNDIFSKVIDKPRYKYWINNSYLYYKIKEEKNEWHIIQRVSINEEEILGFIEASISRECNYVENLSYLFFGTDCNKFKSNLFPKKDLLYEVFKNTFKKDVYRFIHILLDDMKFNKIVLSYIPENPYNDFTNKLIKKFYGKEVGIHKNHVKLVDGKMYDLKYFEILK